MAKVSLALTSEVEIGKVDQILTVKSTNGRKIGALKFSKGAVEWWPKGNSVNVHEYTWEQLAAVLEGSKPTVRAAKKAVKPAAKASKPTVKRVLRTKPNAK
ncbi:hypothetical protein [Burkholderia contaminans]|uniref:hypothetical protein n=1 Tax=Burkholderia contaminans TaxID=488447 RepID=UPI000B114CE0|nr:hypothetical protein [Burkholderia contaminans]MEB4631148.1 hypothetical protein [Burkholderia contaminans]MEB4638004.1 hypothetical protein [Burkholderia contaminans]MEB4653088.1 hypothetical protein [Burkholderia contaminans]MEB4658124.1 hypothetical protein [Burkholderia contaminans]MEB4668366.1 hypothetical protein [Burkholderia contaminans]